jgi:hypothetical protein
VRIHLCLVSSDPGANELVRKERRALIPKSLRDHQRMTDIGAEFSMSVYDPTTAGRSLAQYLLEGEGSQFVALLLDTSLGDVAKDIACACFVANVEFAAHPKTNYKNYFASTLSRFLKHIVAFLAIMGDGANEQAMLLPFRNFNAQQLRDLRDVCRKETLSSEFINMVESHVAALKKRQRPHRKSNYPDRHYVDDDEKLFQYGLEEHARLATGTPHTPVCVLTGKFRFGKRIETNRHYNVTKEFGRGTQIAGKFPDCHDEVHEVTSTTHLNIFSNDYRA